MQCLPTVIIVQRRLTHYRIPLFQLLRTELVSRGIHLEVFVGQGTLSEEQKRDSGTLDWAKSIPTYYFFRGRICWQPVYRYTDEASLVIVTQENKLIVNLLLMLFPRKFKLAFWGHGANLQSDKPNGFKERFKRWTTNQADWWFTYTGISSDIITAAGFPANHITVLNNSVDTAELCQQRNSITSDETQALQRSLGFGDGPVGVYVGSLYSDKRLDFLYDAAVTIRHEISNFQLLVVGDGPERNKMQTWTSNHPWIKWVGARFGGEKVAYLCMAKVMLSPGAVGLGILDAFVCCVPILTTNCGNHGPEIAYLENGNNGVMTANTLEDYTAAAVRLLRNPEELDTLRSGCAMSSTEYNLENMVRRFADGIEQVLKHN